MIPDMKKLPLPNSTETIGMTIDVNDEHLKNELFPILVTVEGTSTKVNDLQLQKQPSSIDEIDEGMMIDFKCRHFAKA